MVAKNGFSSDYGDISAKWSQGNNHHWCGWSTNGGGANLVLDMGNTITAASYAFKLHGTVCGNDPQKWTMECSLDGNSYTHEETVEYDCNNLDHNGGWNTFTY
jgi:hypothetical protein